MNKHLIRITTIPMELKYLLQGQMSFMSKNGFDVNVGDCRGTLKQELVVYTEEKFIKAQDLFNYDYISNLVANHVYAKEDNTFKVWSFYCFQKWYKNTF
jgi:asparagine synthase (glutamine-hydrolysing)|tara:strand:+ start:294 stop:590 length:297 start_codon:yes stop_codon:yes gene_type:complete